MGNLQLLFLPIPYITLQTRAAIVFFVHAFHEVRVRTFHCVEYSVGKMSDFQGPLLLASQSTRLFSMGSATRGALINRHIYMC